MIAQENVVVRLKQTLKRARTAGFKVRMEVLDDEQASWCEIGGVPVLFVDLSQTASEQLQQVEEILAAYFAASTDGPIAETSMAGRPSNAESIGIPPIVASYPQNRAA